MISRAQWGARKARHRDSLPLSRIDTIVIHYSAAYHDEFPSYSARVRETQNFHMDVRGWNDIAYNFLVARDGTLFEGRGWDTMPAATEHHNSHTIAICFLGSDKVGRDDVTDAGRKALANFIRDVNKRAKRTLKVKGHRDFNSTDCPGNELYHWIQLKGWEKNNPIPLPNWFYTWVAWKLGEGAFKTFGPANPRHRPKNIPARIPLRVWTAYGLFLARRKK